MTDILINTDNRTVSCVKCGDTIQVDSMKGNVDYCKCFNIRLVKLRNHIELTYPNTNVLQLKRNFRLFETPVIEKSIISTDYRVPVAEKIKDLTLF